MSFQIIRKDITKVRADAIVNTANARPVYGDGTDRAVYEAAGKEELLAERKKIGNIARGQAAVTPAFGLKADYIIHTVAPVWRDGHHGEFETLQACYENSLQLALERKCRSIAFPLIAAGVNGFPKDKALKAAVSVIEPFVAEHSMKVILVVYNKQAFQLSGALADNVREYVMSHYEPEVCETGAYDPSFDDLSDEEIVLRNRRNYCITEVELTPPCVVPRAEKKPSAPKKKVDIDALLASSEKTFQEKLFEIIDARGLTGPQVYKNYISKQVYSKIQADKDYHPNKFTAIALCLSLHLNLEETKDLIGRAGWTLSPSSRADLVVAGCIMNEEYNLVEINILLFDYDCPVLEKIK